MSNLIICRLDQIAQAATRFGAREMVSLLSEGHNFHRPGVIDPKRHLLLSMNDTPAEIDGMTAPGEKHVSELIAFARSWDRSAPLLVHCWFGISRSPAAALVAALALAPDQDEVTLAKRLRAASPYATPNPLIIKLGDGLLGREGRLIRAVKQIGRGAETDKGDIFQLAVEPNP